MRMLLWFVSILCSVTAAILAAYGLAIATGAPQEAAAAAIALTLAIIPYCIARGVSEMVAIWRGGEK